MSILAGGGAVVMVAVAELKIQTVKTAKAAQQELMYGKGFVSMILQNCVGANGGNKWPPSKSGQVANFCEL